MKTFVCLLLATFSTLLAPATHAADFIKVREILRKAYFGEAMDGAYRQVVRHAFTKLTPEQQACFDEIPADRFLNAAAEHVAPQITDDQLGDAYAFYKTPTGVKWLKIFEQALRNDTSPNPFTEEERVQYAAFKATPAGGLLLEFGKVMRSKEAHLALAELMKERSHTCGVPLESAGK